MFDGAYKYSYSFGWQVPLLDDVSGGCQRNKFDCRTTFFLTSPFDKPPHASTISPLNRLQ